MVSVYQFQNQFLGIRITPTGIDRRVQVGHSLTKIPEAKKALPFCHLGNTRQTHFELGGIVIV